ncbi:hypothetical protein D3C85_1494780 [compost metagenome]
MGDVDAGKTAGFGGTEQLRQRLDTLADAAEVDQLVVQLEAQLGRFLLVQIGRL